MLVVQKYGGATLADATKVRAVAERIAKEVGLGKKIVAVVSAMGSTTNELIALAHQVSPRPTLREMDMLLTTGERISTALVSMALNHLGIQATSLTGSQAGILTNDSHSNAFIQDIKGFRVQEALDQGRVVVLAGFQGVCSTTKEITTLGRGGTDTTAIAMAAYLKAHHCEILKEVAGVFSADPRVVAPVQPISELTYEQMAEMTFWGAKVLHYRSVELALGAQVPIFISSATDSENGTWIRVKGKQMFEKSRILSLNSYAKILRLESKSIPFHESYSDLTKKWEASQIALPQFLAVDQQPNKTEIWVTGPDEIIKAIESWTKAQNDWQLSEGQWASVTATCTGTTSPELYKTLQHLLEKSDIRATSCRWSALSLSFLIPAHQREKALQTLHTLIENS